MGDLTWVAPQCVQSLWGFVMRFLGRKRKVRYHQTLYRDEMFDWSILGGALELISKMDLHTRPCITRQSSTKGPELLLFLRLWCIFSAAALKPMWCRPGLWVLLWQEWLLQKCGALLLPVWSEGPDTVTTSKQCVCKMNCCESQTSLLPLHFFKFFRLKPSLEAKRPSPGCVCFHLFFASSWSFANFAGPSCHNVKRRQRLSKQTATPKSPVQGGKQTQQSLNAGNGVHYALGV